MSLGIMISQKDLPETIPVFPLPGALMLPRARLPLHIFEPRYLAMIEDCMKTKTRLIGMVQPRETPGGEKRLHSIGCAGRLTGFSETEDGRYMITLTGTSRFRIREEVQGFTPIGAAPLIGQALAATFPRPKKPMPALTVMPFWGFWGAIWQR